MYLSNILKRTINKNNHLSRCKIKQPQQYKQRNKENIYPKQPNQENIYPKQPNQENIKSQFNKKNIQPQQFNQENIQHKQPNQEDMQIINIINDINAVYELIENQVIEKLNNLCDDYKKLITEQNIKFDKNYKKAIQNLLNKICELNNYINSLKKNQIPQNGGYDDIIQIVLNSINVFHEIAKNNLSSQKLENDYHYDLLGWFLSVEPRNYIFNDAIMNSIIIPCKQKEISIYIDASLIAYNDKIENDKIKEIYLLIVNFSVYRRNNSTDSYNNLINSENLDKAVLDINKLDINNPTNKINIKQNVKAINDEKNFRYYYYTLIKTQNNNYYTTTPFKFQHIRHHHHHDKSGTNYMKSLIDANDYKSFVNQYRVIYNKLENKANEFVYDFLDTFKINDDSINETLINECYNDKNKSSHLLKILINSMIRDNIDLTPKVKVTTTGILEPLE